MLREVVDSRNDRFWDTLSRKRSVGSKSGGGRLDYLVRGRVNSDGELKFLTGIFFPDLSRCLTRLAKNPTLARTRAVRKAFDNSMST